MHPIRLVAPVAALVLSFAALAAPAATVAQSPSDARPTLSADWPMFRGDAARRGESAEGIVGMPVLRWRYQAQGAVNASMAVVGDLAYASSDDGILHALDLASGAERWFFSPTHTPVSAPSVADGVLYMFDGIGTLFALDAATGEEHWHAATPLDGPSGPTIADGSLYVGTAGGDLVAVDTASGAERWRYAVSPGTGVHSPAYADGLVYVASNTGGYAAVDASTGQLVWHVDTGTDVTGTAVVADGIAYIGGTDDAVGHLRALDARTGASLWQTTEPMWAPAVSGGVAYAGSHGGLVAAYDAATGRELWHFQVQGIARGTAVADGVVYVPADSEHRVYALDATTGTELWHFDVDGNIDGGISIAHGAVFLGTGLGGVYDIGGDSSAAPSTPGGSTAPATTPVASAGAAPSDDPLAGMWLTDPIAKEDFVAAFVAAGGSQADGDSFFGGPDGSHRTMGMRFDIGTFTLYVRNDDGPIGVAEQDRYTLSDGVVTLALTGDPTCYGRFAVTQSGDQLRLELVEWHVGSPTDCPPAAYPVTLEASFPFFREGTRTVSPAPVTSPAARLPEGRYATAPLTQDMIRAAVIAAGYDPGPVQSTPKTVVFTLQFDTGRLTIFGSDVGGPISQMWNGRYEVVDDHTVIARDAISTITYDYSLVGDVLTMRMVTDTLQDPGELAAQAGIYDTAPFTRVH